MQDQTRAKTIQGESMARQDQDKARQNNNKARQYNTRARATKGVTRQDETRLNKTKTRQ